MLRRTQPSLVGFVHFAADRTVGGSSETLRRAESTRSIPRVDGCRSLIQTYDRYCTDLLALFAPRR